MIGVEMSEEKGKTNLMALDKEIEDTIHGIILACGTRPLKEKVTLLYLTINYIYAHNKELEPSFKDLITIH